MGDLVAFPARWQKTPHGLLVPKGADPLHLCVNVYIDQWRVDARGIHTLERRDRVHNLVMRNGVNYVRDLLYGTALGGLTGFKVGTGTSAVTSLDTDLQASVLSDVLTSLSVNDGLLTATYFLTSTMLNGDTLSEIGIFNATPTMFARTLLSPTIAKTSSKAITFTWQIGISSSATMSFTTGALGFIYLDGDSHAFAYQTSFPTGGTYDKVVEGSTVIFQLPSDLPVGNYSLEAVVKTDNALGQGTIALFNLDDAPDTALTGSTVTGSIGNTTGERVGSGTITFDAPSVAKNYGVKVKGNNASYGISVSGIRIVKTS